MRPCGCANSFHQSAVGCEHWSDARHWIQLWTARKSPSYEFWIILPRARLPAAADGFIGFKFAPVAQPRFLRWAKINITPSNIGSIHKFEVKEWAITISPMGRSRWGPCLSRAPRQLRAWASWPVAWPACVAGGGTQKQRAAPRRPLKYSVAGVCDPGFLEQTHRPRRYRPATILQRAARRLAPPCHVLKNSC